MSIAPRNNKVALQPIHPMESRSVRYIPDTDIRTAMHNIDIKERFGLNPLVLCKCCSASLEVDYSVGGMKARLMAFCDAHEECKPNEISTKE